ncbi:MAG: vitamin K epoxide reductase family protein [Pyrinomonadaceae bacterium]
MPWTYISIAAFSLVGLTDSIYLTVEHLAGRTVPCRVVTGCSEVLHSAYATVGNLPLAGLGVVAYFCVLSLAILAIFGFTKTANFILPLVAVMFVATLYLFYLQAFVIQAFCFYCLISGVITLLLLVSTSLNRFLVLRQKQ